MAEPKKTAPARMPEREWVTRVEDLFGGVAFLFRGRRRAWRTATPFGAALMRRAFWEQFFRGDRSVAVLVEGLQGFGCGFDFLGGNRAIVIAIEHSDDRRSGTLLALALRRTWRLPSFFRALGTFRRFRTKLVRGQTAIAVGIQGGKGCRCVGDFRGGQRSIMVRVDRADYGRWRRGHAVTGRVRRLGGGGEARGEGKHDLDVVLFHWFVRFWFLLVGRLQRMNLGIVNAMCGMPPEIVKFM